MRPAHAQCPSSLGAHPSASLGTGHTLDHIIGNMSPVEAQLRGTCERPVLGRGWCFMGAWLQAGGFHRLVGFSPGAQRGGPWPKSALSSLQVACGDRPVHQTQPHFRERRPRSGPLTSSPNFVSSMSFWNLVPRHCQVQTATGRAGWLAWGLLP